MRRPPELLPVLVAAAGGLALAVGAVAAIDGNPLGIVLAAGGGALLWWSVRVRRP
jgi:hypothetical protein